MHKNLLEALLNWPRAYVSGTDLCFLLDKSPASRYAVIKRAVKEGYLISIRRDLYLIKNHPKKSSIDLFSIASIIFGPSYVSCESALSFHGWIPEAVRTITSVTVKKSKEFDTFLGLFSYQHIPVKAFPFGVESRLQNEAVFAMASPWKALADMIYIHKRSWQTVQDLSDDLRIGRESLENSDSILLDGLMQNYPSTRVQKTLRLLQKELFQ